MPPDWTKYRKVNGKIVTKTMRGRRYWQLKDGKWEVQARRTRYKLLRFEDGSFAEVGSSMLKALGEVVASPEFYELFKRIHAERRLK